MPVTNLKSHICAVVKRNNKTKLGRDSCQISDVVYLRFRNNILYLQFKSHLNEYYVLKRAKVLH